jgi:hypothetical protein
MSVELQVFEIIDKNQPEDAPSKVRHDRYANSAPPRVRPIIEEEARRTGYTVAEIIGPGRSGNLPKARQYAIWRAKRETGRSLGEIGREFGGRDHTTVLYACRCIESLPEEERHTIGVKPPPPIIPQKIRKPRNTSSARFTAEIYEDPVPCAKCGGALKYLSTGRCVACRRQEDHDYRKRVAGKKAQHVNG